MLFACPPFCSHELVVVCRMTSDCPSRPFARCKTAEFAFWAEQNVRETSRFFTKKPKEVYFCPVRFCQVESATSHTYKALTNYLILTTIDGSRRNLFYYKMHGFWLTNHLFKKNPEDSRYRWRVSRSKITTKVLDSMALVFIFPTYHPTW